MHPTNRTADADLHSVRQLMERRTRMLERAELLQVARQLTTADVELPIVAWGFSMLPTIRPGAVVLLAPHRGCYRVDDVVLTETAGHPTLHRIVRITHEQVVTRGDSCVFEDRAVGRNAVLAVALLAEDGGRRAVLRLTARFGIRALVRGLFFRARLFAVRTKEKLQLNIAR